LVAVAIDRDKGSQVALKWTIEHLAQKGQTVILIHVNLKQPLHSSASLHSPRGHHMAGENTLVCADPDQHTKELFLPFRCFCTRKDIHAKDIVLEDRRSESIN